MRRRCARRAAATLYATLAVVGVAGCTVNPELHQAEPAPFITPMAEGELRSQGPLPAIPEREHGGEVPRAGAATDTAWAMRSAAERARQAVSGIGVRSVELTDQGYEVEVATGAYSDVDVLVASDGAVVPGSRDQHNRWHPTLNLEMIPRLLAAATAAGCPGTVTAVERTADRDAEYAATVRCATEEIEVEFSSDLVVLSIDRDD